MMLAFADWIILSGGWARRLIALCSGAFGALALAPIGFGAALLVPMIVAVWLIDGAAERGLAPAWLDTRALRHAFGAGWWLGFGYFLAGFWWLGAAFLIDPEFTWALPIGVLGVPALLAIFPAFGFALARLLWRPGAIRVLALAFGLTLSEWARGHLFTGFPWNAFGMGLGGWLVTAQGASLVGLDGLTFLSVALCAAPATLADTGPARLRWRPTLLAALATGAIVAFGAVRLAGDAHEAVPHVTVRIMQPGLRPDLNFSPENKDAIVSRYIELSERDDVAKGVKLSDVTMLVWPESAFPFILTREPAELARIGAFLPSATTLVTGAAREDDLPVSAGGAPHSEYFNSIMMIASGGTIIGSYDKIHLVPFGEYLPFDALLRRLGLRNFVSVPGGFAPGRIRRPLSAPGMPAASPLICYEAIFSGEVMTRANSAKRPAYLLNVTNDGWFGLTSGPWQHFAQTRLRAIEEGLPLVRAAATGVSAVLDPYGSVLAFLPLGADGVLDSRLPQSIAPPFFARHGDLLLWCLMSATMLLLIVSRLNRSKTIVGLGRPAAGSGLFTDCIP